MPGDGIEHREWEFGFMTDDALRRQRKCFWDDDGLLFPIRVLDADEVARFRTRCDELERRLGGAPRTVDVRQMHLHFPWAWELASHPRVLDAIEILLGPDLIVWATELFAKHPRTPAISIGWHRDRTYMGFSPRASVTAWIALSESSAENGGLQALPGADRDRRTPETGTPINVALRAGEMSVHDDQILHGSSGNQSDVKRVGFVVRFVTPPALESANTSWGVVARGCHGMEGPNLRSPPACSDESQALSEMKVSAARHFDVMLQTVRTEHMRNRNS